jgi:hypothetical protein
VLRAEPPNFVVECVYTERHRFECFVSEAVAPSRRLSMSNLQTVTFQEALDIVESLPEHQQENLARIILARIHERRRELIVENIKEAQAEYARGECHSGTVEDLMRELTED